MIELAIEHPDRHQLIACEAVLFDLDGTLVDSHACVEQAMRQWGTRHGLDVDELLRISHGRQNEEVVRIIAPHLETAEELARLARAEEDCTGVRPIRGARRLLNGLDPGRWAVVTSAWRHLAELRLRQAGLPVPPVLVTADDVRQGKPHPEGFLQAADRLGVEAAGCVVVEDAVAGIAAARAAEMSVIGITTTLTPRDIDCAWCVEDLACLTIRTRSGGPDSRPEGTHPAEPSRPPE
jgi:sugar-phosphatase